MFILYILIRLMYIWVMKFNKIIIQNETDLDYRNVIQILQNAFTEDKPQKQQLFQIDQIEEHIGVRTSLLDNNETLLVEVDATKLKKLDNLD